MQKITILIFSLLFISSFTYGQSQRMVLAEESTSSTCGPCGQQNPGFDALLEANSDIVTSIKYHVWWPPPGNDPMYLHNIVDNTARTNYYNINSVPRAVIDGTYFNGQPVTVSQAMLNSAAAEPSPFNIQIQHELSPEEDYIYVTTLIEATDDASGNLVAHCAVIEKHISFATPPGTNGEKDFYNVMKKMLPTANGTELPDSWEAGDYVIIQNSWMLENIYDINELGVVGFVQDDVLKDVHQAANSSTEPLSPVYTNDAELLQILNVPATNCSGTISPVLEIRNNGSASLTSAVIEYSINGGETNTYNWSGDLGFLETDQVNLDELVFDPLDENEFEANIISINDDNDDYVANNLNNITISQGVNVAGNLGLWLLLDDHPEETTWEILNSNGEIVQSGGPYESAGQQYEPITVSLSDCYEFIIYDAGGNGLEYYALVYGNQEVAFEGGAFGYYEKNQFGFDLVGIEDKLQISDFQLFPNPASDFVNIGFYLPEDADVALTIVNMVGKQIYREERLAESFGPKQFQIDVAGFQAGIYFLSVETGSGQIVHKISIQ